MINWFEEGGGVDNYESRKSIDEGVDKKVGQAGGEERGSYCKKYMTS